MWSLSNVHFGFFVFFPQDESLITQILDIMVHPHKFFYLPKNAKNKLPEFYSFVEKKVEAKLNLKPYK